MNILKPGPGNQSANRKAAVEYITSNIFEAESVDVASGRFTSTDGDSYQVSAYAETPAALISTPKVDESQPGTDASRLRVLMFRQLKHDKRSFVYEVDPQKITLKPRSSSAEWLDVSKIATRIWVCTSDEIKLINKIAKDS
jgi:hypothetical protein